MLEVFPFRSPFSSCKNSLMTYICIITSPMSVYDPISATFNPSNFNNSLNGWKAFVLRKYILIMFK